jgi:hypothetical protein
MESLRDEKVMELFKSSVLLKDYRRTGSVAEIAAALEKLRDLPMWEYVKYWLNNYPNAVLQFNDEYFLAGEEDEGLLEVTLFLNTFSFPETNRWIVRVMEMLEDNRIDTDLQLDSHPYYRVVANTDDEVVIQLEIGVLHWDGPVECVEDVLMEELLGYEGRIITSLGTDMFHQSKRPGSVSGKKHSPPSLQYKCMMLL